MSRKQFRQVEELFHAAAGKELAEREAFLAEAAGDDEQLRNEVRALLDADETEISLLAGPLVRSPREVLEPEGDPEGAEPVGRIGPYRILGRLGRGGMSTVYLAERDDGAYRQRVAIKLIRHGRDHAETLRRFRQERQILASLEHPSIARLLDGGRADDGSPYVVMEAIDGLPIDLYCAREGLSVERRVELFRQVCDAVHYAHQRLIVHRDLKPGNVLVTADGVPKLLDFGIAKILHAELSQEELVSTLPFHQLMTPAYASPEQIRGEPVSTACDVYGLGLLLYEILTGQKGHRLETREPREIERVICEEEPVAPSRAPAETAPAGIDPARLAGDLDAVVLKALAKEPRHRYPSAGQLSEDLGRYLAHRPVAARPPTPLDRLAKLARRKPLATSLAVLVVVLVAAVGVQAWRLGRALRVAEAETARALEERARGEEVTSFLVDLFEGADPHRATDGTVSTREILDRGARRVDLELGEQPATQATLLDTIGRVYQNLALFDDAEHSFERALRLRRELRGEMHPEVAESLERLAFLRHLQYELDEAETLSRRTLEMRRSLYGERHREVAVSLHNLAEVLATQGRTAEAEPLFAEALTMRRELLGDRHAEVAESLAELGLMRTNSGDPESAEPLLREAVEIWRQELGSKHPTLALGLSYLAFTDLQLEDYATAEILFEEALAIQSELLGEDHPETVDTLASLGRVFYEQKRFPEAREALHRALEVHERGPAGPMLGTCRNDLARVYMDEGRYPEADELYRRSLEVFRETLGHEHPAVRIVLVNQARNFRLWGKLAAAEERFREALALERSADPSSRAVALNVFELARVLNERGSAQEAEALLHRSLALVEDSEPWTAVLESELAASFLALGKPEEAEPLLRRSHSVLAEAGEAWAVHLENARQRLEAVAEDLTETVTVTETAAETAARATASAGVAGR